jgi:pimeloyl-ACP methyl ester carboxylesterase
MESILKNTPLRFVKLQNGETIAYRDFKHDSAVLHTIVLVHGNNQDNRAWLPFVVNIALNDHRIIAMDMRGYGESSYVNRVESHDDNADDIYNLM